MFDCAKKFARIVRLSAAKTFLFLLQTWFYVKLLFNVVAGMPW